MISHAGSVGVNVRDQDRAVAFFCHTLGFEKRLDEPMGREGGPRWIVVAPHGAQSVIVPFAAEDPATIGNFTNIIFETDDIATTHEELAGRGVRFAQPPERYGWGWWAQFVDPDGNEYGLVERSARH